MQHAWGTTAGQVRVNTEPRTAPVPVQFKQVVNRLDEAITAQQLKTEWDFSRAWRNLHYWMEGPLPSSIKQQRCLPLSLQSRRQFINMNPS